MYEPILYHVINDAIVAKVNQLNEGGFDNCVYHRGLMSQWEQPIIQ